MFAPTPALTDVDGNQTDDQCERRDYLKVNDRLYTHAPDLLASRSDRRSR